MASVAEAKSSADESFLASFTRVAILDNTFDPLKMSAIGLDTLEYADWLEVHSVMRKNLQLSPAYLLGLNDQNYSWDRWLSYMFVHIGFLHLLSNAMFLLIFGALIETLFGGVVVTLVFLGSGFLAAPMYMLLNDLNQVSLVGASGGVCGLIAFYSITQFKEKIRFFYWVLPFEKYYGFLSLSCGYIFLIWILSDLAGYFAGVGFLDSVAYGAHLGGFLVGGLCALGLNFYKSLKPSPRVLQSAT
jgi:membrane associated rhomboid family serine protease